MCMNPNLALKHQARARAHQGSCLTDAVTSAVEAKLTPPYRPSGTSYLSAWFSGLVVLWGCVDITVEVTPEAALCVVGDVFLPQSSEFVDDVEVGVMGTELLLPEEPFDLLRFFGFRFLVCIPSFFIASGLGTPCSFI